MEVPLIISTLPVRIIALFLLNHRAQLSYLAADVLKRWLKWSPRFGFAVDVFDGYHRETHAIQTVG
jgi:hypothetical protein